VRLHRENRDGPKGIAARGRPAREETPRGKGADFKGRGVLPASGRGGLGKARAGPDCEAGAVCDVASWRGQPATVSLYPVLNA
jgi:hypothetical protein